MESIVGMGNAEYEVCCRDGKCEKSANSILLRELSSPRSGLVTKSWVRELAFSVRICFQRVYTTKTCW
jgi:hypothetical protein